VVTCDGKEKRAIVWTTSLGEVAISLTNPCIPEVPSNAFACIMKSIVRSFLL